MSAVAGDVAKGVVGKEPTPTESTMMTLWWSRGRAQGGEFVAEGLVEEHSARAKALTMALGSSRTFWARGVLAAAPGSLTQECQEQKVPVGIFLC